MHTIPLNEVVKALIKTSEQQLKAPVEIEFVVTLSNLQTIEETAYIKHVRTKKPLIIKADGKTGRGIIQFSDEGFT